MKVQNQNRTEPNFSLGSLNMNMQRCINCWKVKGRV